MAPHYHSCVTIGNEHRGNMASAIVSVSGKTTKITHREHDFFFTDLPLQRQADCAMFGQQFPEEEMYGGR